MASITIILLRIPAGPEMVCGWRARSIGHVDRCENFGRLFSVSIDRIHGGRHAVRIQSIISQPTIESFLANKSIDSARLPLFQCEQLCDDIYAVPWHRLPVKLQKVFVIVLQNAQSPNLMTIGDLAPLNLASELSVRRFKLSARWYRAGAIKCVKFSI